MIRCCGALSSAAMPARGVVFAGCDRAASPPRLGGRAKPGSFAGAVPASSGGGFQGLTAQQIREPLGVQHHNHRIARVSHL